MHSIIIVNMGNRNSMPPDDFNSVAWREYTPLFQGADMTKFRNILQEIPCPMMLHPELVITFAVD